MSGAAWFSLHPDPDEQHDGERVAALEAAAADATRHGKQAEARRLVAEADTLRERWGRPRIESLADLAVELRAVAAVIERAVENQPDPEPTALAPMRRWPGSPEAAATASSGARAGGRPRPGRTGGWCGEQPDHEPRSGCVLRRSRSGCARRPISSTCWTCSRGTTTWTTSDHDLAAPVTSRSPCHRRAARSEGGPARGSAMPSSSPPGSSLPISASPNPPWRSSAELGHSAQTVRAQNHSHTEGVGRPEVVAPDSKQEDARYGRLGS